MLCSPQSSARSGRSRLWRAVVGALLASAVAVPAAHAGTASQTVQSGSAPLMGGFSARALDDKGEITPKTYFELSLKPGETYDGSILVTNAASDFVRLRVDSVDGLTGETSGTVYANRTDPRKETSTWITPKKEALRLDGKSARRLGFRLKVPDDATPGDHVGAVAFQRVLKPKGEGQFSVRQVLRVAVAIQIKVKGPANAKLELGGISLKALGGTQIPSVTIQLRNTGQLLCRPSLTVAMAKGGDDLGTVSRQLDTILAGDTIDYPLPWPKPLDPGTYDIDASTTGCGQPAQLKQSVKLDGALRGSEGAPGQDSAALGDDGAGIPWWALLLAVLGALGLGFFVARRTNRKDGDPPGGAAAAAPESPAPATPAASAPAAEPSAPAAEVPAEDAPTASEAESTGKAVAIEPEPAPRTDAF